eukprot:CAMPEP_0181341248 /NCGR_PEP_ID=MMETSP1101-20121128/30298_1 /TAXON_ID=46948 /ORGANISM="Rhodomonas abbreviata, Strain Caron Lab Isolate" /LENGTH=241 /DNA_ID=CAMNT_0023452491 /DNA_START=268 /DNA_END=993 /DNA_ORIENTATION=-
MGLPPTATARYVFQILVSEHDNEKALAVAAKENEKAVAAKENEKALAAKENEKALALAAKENEKALALSALNLTIMENGLKEKSRLIGQRMLYEKFLSQCWAHIQSLDQGSAAIANLRANVENFPKNATKVKAPKKTTVDNAMRVKIPEIENILSSILDSCTLGACTLPRARPDYTYGVLSDAVHLPVGQELYVRDDEAEDVKMFFLCLAEQYGIPGEVLDSNYIAWFEKERRAGPGMTAT